MQLEAQEKLTQAAEYYENVLSEDQTNLVLPVTTWTNIRWCGNAESPFFDLQINLLKQ
jgi:hypothetical protein